MATVSQTGQNTREYRAIKRHYASLVDTLGKTVDPAHFARKLCEKSLISENLVEKASLMGVLTGSDRISPAIVAVLSQIKLKANNFHTFMSILKTEDSCLHLADTINEYYTSSLELHALGVLESVSEWKELGHQLNIDPKKLLQLSQCGKDPEYCREQVVSEWLEEDKEASWEKLCSALEQMESPHEAEVLKIREHYIDVVKKKISPSQPHSHLQPHPTSPQQPASDEVNLALQTLTAAVHNTIQRPFHGLSNEDAIYLQFMQNRGKLEGAKDAIGRIVINSEISGVPLIGTEDERRKAWKLITEVLATKEKSKPLEIPDFICHDIHYSEYCKKCQEEKNAVCVFTSLGSGRCVTFLSDDYENCRAAAKWVEQEVYPMVITFENIEKWAKKIPVWITKGYVDKRNISTACTELQSMFLVLEKFQDKLRVGYEARFAEKPDQPDYRIRRGQYDFLPSVEEADVCRVISILRAENCLEQGRAEKPKVKRLVDPLKIKVTPKSGGNKAAEVYIAVVEELPYGRFHLNKVYRDHSTKARTPKFDFFFSDRKYGMRIAPNFFPVVSNISLEAASDLVSTISRREDGKLEMALRGSTEDCTYYVKFMRCKKEIQHPWVSRDRGKKWVLVEYDVQKFDSEGKLGMWRDGEKDIVPFEPKKKELELWGPKKFGSSIAKSAGFTEDEIKELKGRGAFSSWSMVELLSEFEEFVQTSEEISNLLST